ncbi:DUF3592 domain-containing protein [Hymenobacter negativus]|uniref:DUF3592 domain-containing protein n=1 Tax=Hymenobacter negativus TaxID=2795026 RepID=A0ABS0Q1B9_9BACT|nr:DUF3592 domain-containing protein [Hymenobacter negativus]MBH8556418.1 DUF3592 domain-containing protein [Hymenobacter negativus]
MLLTLGDKLRIYFGNTNFLLGLLFCAVGLVLMTNFLPTVDFESAWFITQPIAQASGTIVSASSTDYTESEDEDRIWEIDYTFNLAGHLYKNHSYSSSQNVRPGTVVQIEYVSAQPNHSRILSTSNAPYMLWTLLPVLGCAISGLAWVYKSGSYCRQVIAIAEDAFVAPAVRTQIKTKALVHDEEQEYKAHYVYSFNNIEYHHILDVSETKLKQLHQEENIALQRSFPPNAMLVANLPRSLQNRLTSPPYPA